MSLDLFQQETAERMSTMPPVVTPEPGVFDGFLRGAGMYSMRGLAKTARAIDMAGAVGPMVQDAFTGGTEAQDRYFREHDDVFNRAVDFWTPKPGEVGVAAEVVGSLIGQLPAIIASPHLAVGAQVLDTAEDLVRKGIDSGKAVTTGVVQGAGLATGIWMPVIGRNLWERALIGGAGFNAAQGMVTRAASEIILDGSPAAKEFEAFDWKSVTLDALLGVAFGSLAHFSPAQRAQGAAVLEKLKGWAEKLEPSQVDALASLRTAQHLNMDSAPGKPQSPSDVEAHVDRMRTAIDQLANDRPVQVNDLPGANFESQARHFEQAARRAEDLQKTVDRVATAEGLQDVRRVEIEKFLEGERVRKGEEAVRKAAEETLNKVDAEGVPGFLRSASDLIALRQDKAGETFDPIVQQAIDIAKKPGFERTADEKLLLESALDGKLSEYLQPRNAKEESALGAEVSDALKTLKKTEAPAGTPRGGEPPPRPSGEPAGAEANPLEREAERIVAEQPDRVIRIGVNADGSPIMVSAKQFLEDARAAADEARNDAGLFEAAAQCMLRMA